MTTSHAGPRSWTAIGVLILFLLSAAVGWIQGLAFSASTALAGQTVIPSFLAIILARALSSPLKSRSKYRVTLGGAFCLSYNVLGSALLSAPPGIEVPFLINGVSPLYAAIMLVGGLVAGYVSSLQPLEMSKLRSSHWASVGSGICAFAGVSVSGLLQGGSLAMAVGMGGQAVLPALFAGWVGLLIRRRLLHRPLLGRAIPFALGLALFAVSMAVLAVPPDGIRILFFSDNPAWLEGVAGLFVGAVAGGVLHLFDPDRQLPENPAPA
jgi:hypothetical protein